MYKSRSLQDVKVMTAQDAAGPSEVPGVDVDRGAGLQDPRYAGYTERRRWKGRNRSADRA